MTIQAQSADGVIHEFPDGTKDAVIDGAMKAYAASKAPPKGIADTISGLMANVNRGLGVGDELAAGANTIRDVVTGKSGPDLVQTYKDELAGQRNRESSFATAHPNAAALARGTGMAATAAIPAGNSANLLAQSPRLVNMARGAVTGGLTAAAYGAADAGSPAERLKAASEGATNPLALGLGAVGGGLGPAASRGAGRGPSPDVAALVKEGVNLTPGQARGGLAKTAEDIATSAPILGTAIQEARKSGLQSFNRAVVNRALKPIGEALPDHIETGTEAVKYAGDTLSAAYKKTLPEGTVRPDARFVADVNKNVTPLAETLSKDNQDALQGILAKRVTDVSKANDNLLDGKTFQKIVQGLDYEIGRFANSADPDHVAMSQALGATKDAIESAAMRQNPTFATAKNKIDLGWANLARVERAAGGAGADGGIFTPAQYNSAISASETKVGGRNRRMARGEGLNQDLAQAAKAVLPSKVPDTGTATRGAMISLAAHAPGAVVGAITGGGPGALAGMAATTGGLAAASRAYSPQAMAAFNAALRSNISQREAASAVGQLGRIAAKEPAARALYREALQRLGRTAGLIGSQSALGRGNPGQ
jgi:hypothetical protein